MQAIALGGAVQSQRSSMSGGRPVLTHQEADRRRLARAIRAEEAEHGAGWDLQVQVLEGGSSAVVLSETARHDRWFGRHRVMMPAGASFRTEPEGPGPAGAAVIGASRRPDG